MIQTTVMTDADIDFAMQLARLSNWNQTEQDWRRLLQIQGDGVFLASCDGTACGTASTTAYGRTSAWIGMVLVHPDFRRRGVGSTLMNRCLEYLRQIGVECIKLDATDQGRPVYLKLGFRDERAIGRYCRRGGADLPAGHAMGDGSSGNGSGGGDDGQIGPIGEADWPAIAAIDPPAFGADRLRLLKLLAADGRSALVRRGEEITGYGFSRPGHLADYLGPIVARDAASARQIVSHLLRPMASRDVFWDLLPDNAAALQLATELGFVEVRRLTRMYLGDKVNGGRVEQIFAAADFALG